MVARRYQPDIIVHCVDPEPNQITVLKLLNIVLDFDANTRHLSLQEKGWLAKTTFTFQFLFFY